MPPSSFCRGRNELNKRKSEGSRCHCCKKKGIMDFSSCFCWYYYDYLWAIEFAPSWFVNICLCTVLLWALDTGKEAFIVFMRITKKKVKCKKKRKKKKSVTIKSSCLLECANPFFFWVQMYTFWKSINYCCTLLLWWQNNRKYEAQSVFVGREVGKAKTSGFSPLDGCRSLWALPRWDPCTHVVR